MKLIFSVLLLSFQTGCVEEPAPAADTFNARGNEPGWRLEITDEQVILLMDYGTVRVEAPTPAPVITGDVTTYTATIDGRTLTAVITDQPCADSMSGMPYPTTVTIRFDGRDLQGCGGDPAEVLQGLDWVVKDINGTRIVEGLRGSLNFSEDGIVSGRSFCNAYRGDYVMTGEGLSVELTVSTLMGCEPAIMVQEELFLDVLADVHRFEIDSGGDLILHTSDGRTIRAGREYIKQPANHAAHFAEPRGGL